MHFQNQPKHPSTCRCLTGTCGPRSERRLATDFPKHFLKPHSQTSEVLHIFNAFSHLTSLLIFRYFILLFFSFIYFYYFRKLPVTIIIWVINMYDRSRSTHATLLNAHVTWVWKNIQCLQTHTNRRATKVKNIIAFKETIINYDYQNV